MLSRIARAFSNDTSLYQEIKGNPQAKSESLLIVAISIFASILLAVLIGFVELILLGSAEGFATLTIVVTSITVLGNLAGYFVIVFLTWLINLLIAKGKGSFTDIRVAIAYAYCVPAILVPITGFVGLWIIVTTSTAVSETLGIGKIPALLITITSAVVTIAIYMIITGVGLVFILTR
jgi:hypothetical protein